VTFAQAQISLKVAAIPSFLQAISTHALHMVIKFEPRNAAERTKEEEKKKS